jgi:hypothetical protein
MGSTEQKKKCRAAQPLTNIAASRSPNHDAARHTDFDMLCCALCFSLETGSFTSGWTDLLAPQLMAQIFCPRDL